VEVGEGASGGGRRGKSRSPPTVPLLLTLQKTTASLRSCSVELHTNPLSRKHPPHIKRLRFGKGVWFWGLVHTITTIKITDRRPPEYLEHTSLTTYTPKRHHAPAASRHGHTPHPYESLTSGRALSASVLARWSTCVWYTRAMLRVALTLLLIQRRHPTGPGVSDPLGPGNYRCAVPRRRTNIGWCSRGSV
jgi:hypothetical protein